MTEYITIVICIISVGLLICLGELARGQCPDCKRLRALEETGEIIDGGFWSLNKEELECKYCGHRLWRDIGEGGGG